MSRKIVAVSDLHIHPWRLCSRDGGQDRLKDGLSVLRQSLQLACEEHAVWVCAGDMKQPKMSWPQQALTGMHEILRQFSDVQKILVAGNHDAEGIGGSGLAPFKDCCRVIEQTETIEPVQGMPLVCAPWNADFSQVRMALDACPKPRILVGHGFLAGCMLGPEDMRIAKGLNPSALGSFTVAIFGDVHKSQWRKPESADMPAMWLPMVVTEQRIRSGEIYYCGSPYQQNWGEREDGIKGALVFDLDKPSVRLHALEAPQYRKIEIDAKGVVAFLDDEDPAVGRDDFVHVIVTGKPSPEAIKDLETFGALQRSFQLTIRRPASAIAKRTEIHAGMSKRTILENYMKAKPFDGDALKTFDAGLRLLTGGEA